MDGCASTGTLGLSITIVSVEKELGSKSKGDNGRTEASAGGGGVRPLVCAFSPAIVGTTDGNGDMEGSREWWPSDDELSGFAMRNPPRD